MLALLSPTPSLAVQFLLKSLQTHASFHASASCHASPRNFKVSCSGQRDDRSQVWNTAVTAGQTCGSLAIVRASSLTLLLAHSCAFICAALYLTWRPIAHFCQYDHELLNKHRSRCKCTAMHLRSRKHLHTLKGMCGGKTFVCASTCLPLRTHAHTSCTCPVWSTHARILALPPHAQTHKRTHAQANRQT
eukprot:2320020-Pleurochrysis_carterae.AAC.1